MRKLIDKIILIDKHSLDFNEVTSRMMHIFMDRYERGDYEGTDLSKLRVDLENVELESFEYDCDFEKPNRSLRYEYEVTCGT